VLKTVLANGLRFEILVHPPTRERPWFLLATMGLSDKTMHAPPEARLGDIHAELMMALPPDWRFHGKALRHERFAWPTRLMVDVARYVHEENPWVWFHHTLGGDGPLAPNLPFTSVLFHYPELLPEEAWCVRPEGGPEIRFLTLLPLYPAELEYRNTNGTHALLAELIPAGVSELFDPGRRPVVS
jgi:hypothetical protein